ncbi:cytochrome P450 [Desmonostoc muscorum LEGE 12446]|uniref:Cytochrome P450 n=1 Tax=Desmonostoc muscorum LEGE 12446 TaxID=1828758 RepID=A0A8J6ZVM2_DESMC|nr:cytochrome P450 [Desmonostoc muscorum]MCF2149898.1 cytochrome P450 [Desmonostoc muscorum LEGE 12446]
MTLPPGPKTPLWLLRQQLDNNPLDCLDAIYKRYGDIVTITSGSTPIVYVSNPSGIKQYLTNTKEITISTIPPGDSPISVGQMGQQGILHIDGLVHKHRRSILMKAYHGERMNASGKTICEITKKIINQQAISAAGYAYPKTFIANEILSKITLQVAIEVVIGLREGERYEKIKHLYTSCMKYEKSTLFNIIKKLPFTQLDLGRLSPWGYHKYLLKEIFQFLYDEVKERRKQADPSCSDMLSDLIFACDETGEPLSDEEVRDLLFLPISASNNGATDSLTWLLYWVHRLTDVREQLLEELDSLGENPDPLRIVALPYLNAVCHETLRIYPSSMFSLPRVVMSPVEIMGYELIPGTVLFTNIYSTHQREDVYPEPKEFKPERFLEKKFSPYEFIPFGGGARSCIAGSFSIFQMKLVLATILSNYKLTLVNKRPERQKHSNDQCYAESGVKMVMHGRRQHQEKSQPLVSDLV